MTEEKLLRTIEEENAIREAAKIDMFTFNLKPLWVKTGIESPFEGEILEEVALPRHDGKIQVKCSKTGKIGIMQTDNTARAIIKDITWEERRNK